MRVQCKHKKADVHNTSLGCIKLDDNGVVISCDDKPLTDETAQKLIDPSRYNGLFLEFIEEVAEKVIPVVAEKVKELVEEVLSSDDSESEVDEIEEAEEEDTVSTDDAPKKKKKKKKLFRK